MPNGYKKSDFIDDILSDSIPLIISLAVAGDGIEHLKPKH